MNFFVGQLLRWIDTHRKEIPSGSLVRITAAHDGLLSFVYGDHPRYSMSTEYAAFCCAPLDFPFQIGEKVRSVTDGSVFVVVGYYADSYNGGTVKLFGGVPGQRFTCYRENFARFVSVANKTFSAAYRPQRRKLTLGQASPVAKPAETEPQIEILQRQSDGVVVMVTDRDEDWVDLCNGFGSRWSESKLAIAAYYKVPHFPFQLGARLKHRVNGDMYTVIGGNLGSDNVDVISDNACQCSAWIRDLYVGESILPQTFGRSSRKLTLT